MPVPRSPVTGGEYDQVEAEPGRTFVWDTTGPLHADRCGRSDVLHGAAGVRRRHVVTDIVAGEIVGKGQEAPVWAEVAQLDTLEGVLTFAAWIQRLGSRPEEGHDVGEAATFAWAELNGATAIVDDRDARNVAAKYLNSSGAARDPDAWCQHGVLWAVAREVVEGRRPSPKASSGFCDSMLHTGINWPFPVGGYPAWFETQRAKMYSTCC